jgi:hypothetical protein
MSALVLVHGAHLTSLGLALATWVKRPGRAVAIGVTLFVMKTIGWPILVMALFAGSATDRTVAEGIACLSPVFATISLVQTGLRRPEDAATIIGWIVFWLLALGLAALGLLMAVVRTFDDCMGRMPEIVSEDISPGLSDQLSRIPSATSMSSSLSTPAGSSPRNG